MKWKRVKSYYYSLLDVFDEEIYSELKQNNSEKKKAKEYAKKVNGKVRVKYYPEDEGYEYQVWQREDLKHWKNIKIKLISKTPMVQDAYTKARLKRYNIL